METLSQARLHFIAQHYFVQEKVLDVPTINSLEPVIFRRFNCFFIELFHRAVLIIMFFFFLKLIRLGCFIRKMLLIKQSDSHQSFNQSSSILMCQKTIDALDYFFFC